MDQLRENQPAGKYGSAFEKLMVNFFRSDPVLANEYEDVCRWVDWRYNGGNADTGIDLVARRREDGRWTAIQCKFYKESTYLQKSHLDSFFEASGHSFSAENGPESFANRIVISTTDKWSANAEKALENQVIPTSRIGLADIAQSPIDWDVAFPGSEIQVNLSRKETFSPRPHQQTAIDKAIEGFETSDRGKLIMACGTGKTFTALRLAEQIADHNGGKARVLFLVPSISLLSQTLKEWTAQACVDLRSIAVCSDTKVSKKAEDIASYDLKVPVSTNGAEIASRMGSGKRSSGLHVIFSTYQSLPAIHDAQASGLDEFDIVICDEAHRTTGVTLAGEEASNFTKVHDADYIRAAKRLYMTATPRLFDDAVKGKAAEHSAEVASMDDEAIFGPEVHRLGFGEAVEAGLLTDYKVLVMTVDEDIAADTLARGDQEINLSLASAMIGAWNGLAKRSGKEQGTKSGFEHGADPMRRSVAFAKDIKTSKQIAESYPALIANYQQSLREASAMSDISELNLELDVEAQHVDGSMNALARNNRISWLESSFTGTETRVLTNARCLSEGVDVPALDSVIFFNPRNSMVDVVQSVGRVMRKSEGKDYGYIILPVAVPPGKSPSEALNDNTRFKVVWQILNALRAHDDRFNAVVNAVSLNEGSPDALPIDVDHIGKTDKDPRNALDESSGNRTDSPSDREDELSSQTLALFSLEQWQEAMYVKIVDKVGTRTYWEDWADDVAEIAQAQITRINAILANANPTLRREFDAFVDGLRNNLNDSITPESAVEMLSQHLITAPVFNALFAEYDFAAHNPVSTVMQRMIDAMANNHLDAETEKLDKFYESVRLRAAAVTSASGKQQVIKELYERFFRKAFKKQAEALGIVYTPVEIVDFILRAANDASLKHFGRGLSDEGVTILDPFAGTSTFMVRLLQSGLIKPEDMARKYASELFATEIMLLAYYVSAVNIETTYNTLQAEEALRQGLPEPDYVPFNGIALADTFQIHEDGDIPDLNIFRENNASIERQKKAPINVIIGNPPYSAGQTSANDLNANLKYPSLDKRIAETYVALSTATNKNSLYDSYLRAFRWATDRIGDQGIVAFVSNGGWIDGNTGDGVRLSMESDFTDMYVFNLRGNQRTAGEQSRKEGGKVFGAGSRSTIAITVGIKDPWRTGFTLHYRNIGDYLSAEDKLDIVNRSNLGNVEWQTIDPNDSGDWLNQRSGDFGTWPVVGEKKGSATKFFETFSRGLSTARDAWAYAQTEGRLLEKMRQMVSTYDEARDEMQRWAARHHKDRITESDVNEFLTSRPTLAAPSKISWNRSLKLQAGRNKQISVQPDRVYTSLYRPFTAMSAYFDVPLNDMVYKMPSMFPTIGHKNIGIGVCSASNRTPFSVLGLNILPNLGLFMDPVQFFPRFTWAPVDADGGLFGEGSVVTQAPEQSEYGEIGEVVDGYVRVDNVTDEIKKIYREALGSDITGDDIFHFVYGKLHDPAYRETYAADLKKMLPHIETPASREEFDKFAAAGRGLMQLHVGYEDVEPLPVTVTVKGDETDRETWRVTKMAWAKTIDPDTGKKINDVTTLRYNSHVTVSDIPAEAEKYMLGSRSALGWVVDRYQVKKDKASGIVNDPNDWADEVGNPRYIVDLVAKVTRVAVETVRIVKLLG